MPNVNASTSFGTTLAFGGLSEASAGAAGFGGAAAAAADTQATVIRDAHSLTAWLLAQHGARLEGGPTEGPLAALLTAGPASGKTTLLSQVVMIALQDERTELVPILVKVQVLQRRLLEAPDAFAGSWNYIDAYLRLEHEANQPALYRMLRQAMMARRALLLLDGLDEAGAKRVEIERHVVDVLAPQGHVLLPGYNVTVLAVPPLAARDAAQLFVRLCPHAQTLQLPQRIAEHQAQQQRQLQRHSAMQLPGLPAPLLAHGYDLLDALGNSKAMSATQAVPSCVCELAFAMSLDDARTLVQQCALVVANVSHVSAPP